MRSLQNLKNLSIFYTLPFHRLCPAHALGCSVNLKTLAIFYTLPFHRLCPVHDLGCSVGFGWSVNANQRLEGLMWLIVWRYAEFAKSQKFSYFLHSPVSSFVSCTCFRLLGRLWMVHERKPKARGLLWLIVWRYAEFAKSQKFIYFLHSPVSSFVSCPCFRLLDRLWMIRERKPKARGVDVTDRMKVCGVCKIRCSVGFGWSVNGKQRLEGLMWLIVWRYAEFAKSQKFSYFPHSPVSSFVSCTCFRLLGRLWMVRECKPKARGIDVTDRMEVCGVCKISNFLIFSTLSCFIVCVLHML